MNSALLETIRYSVDVGKYLIKIHKKDRKVANQAIILDQSKFQSNFARRNQSDAFR